ncbi:hypothetical protein DFH28DRAFT_877964 [Melampsora americana]|nr:hypothetical protein DFH28DRAFT_877964 [Melampsora americana]
MSSKKVNLQEHQTHSIKSNQPSVTLYVQNLCDKIKKQDLRRMLYQLFSIHGKVLDVVALKGHQMRGQAFIVFRDLQGSTQAMRYLDGTSFLDRELKITYALKRSFASIKEIAGEEVLYQVRLGLIDPETLQEVGRSKLTVSGAQAANVKQPADSAAAAAVKAAGSAPVLSGEDPNPVLFLEGLPAEVTDDMMAVLFQQYPGFQSVRLVPGRTGIGFVQYDTSSQSDMAKTALDGFQLAPGVMMKVGFARKG